MPGSDCGQFGVKGEGLFVGVGTPGLGFDRFQYLHYVRTTEAEKCWGKPGGVGVNGTLTFLPSPMARSVSGSMRLRSHP